MKNCKSTLLLALLVALLLTGCGASQPEKQANFTLEVTSIVEAEDCYICGSGHDTLMPVYGATDSIGLIYWNKPVVVDTKVRVYEPDGTERFHTGVLMTGGISSEDGHGYASIHADPDKGISEIKIH